MQMIKTPVNGMKDIEPREMEIRQFIFSKIRDVYSRFGFSEIETPNIEHIENLLSDQGWDNEKLIFKILKRGEKLEKSLESGKVEDIVDSGLRYDLTVPLSRFYSNNKDKLVLPFKAMQIGNVYRADRPQKGRYRQFCQCDIDILGESTNLGEIETLLATSTLLKEIEFDKYNFSFDINDRRILKAIVLYAGFNETDFESVCITLDKLDKIGFDGVKKELIDKGYKEDNIDILNSLFDDYTGDPVAAIKKLQSKIISENTNLGANYDSPSFEKDFINICNNLIEIIETVTKNADVKIHFTPCLVRGMGYYTGPIFEIKSDKFSGSVGGGGRYDDMIGKFTGMKVPALGISIGFERIIGIYLEDDFKVPANIKKIAYLIDKNLDISKKSDIINKALIERKNGNIVYIAELSKNKKVQCEKLESFGYPDFQIFNQ